MKKILILSAIILCFHSLFGQNTPLPPGLQNDPLVLKGFLDVTLLGIDNSGTTDVTDDLNYAIRVARDNRLVCYLPGGTYLVSDTIKAIMRAVEIFPGTWQSDRKFPCVIVGECGNRPTIKLVNGAPGYQTPTSNGSKPVVWIWAMPTLNATPGSVDPLNQEPGIAFNQQFKNIKIELGNNPGASGIRFCGAQGSSMEKIQIVADNAWAGMQSAMGQASGYYDVEVIGCRYAVEIPLFYRPKVEYALFTGLRCINQTEAVFKGLIFFPVIINGFYFENNHGRMFAEHPSSRGGLSLIDGIIRNTGNANNNIAFNLNQDRNLYLKNVYFNGISIAAASATQNFLTLDPSENTRLIEFNHVPDNNNSWKNLDNCQSNDLDLINMETVSTFPSNSVFIDQHIPPTGPCFDDADVIDVTDPSEMNNNPAIGDGSTDDLAALQWAINNADKIFLPKGTYKISGTLELKNQTVLFGAGKVYSILQAESSWNSVNQPMVSSPNDHSASTMITDFMLEINVNTNYNLSGIDWQAGSSSVVKDIMFGSPVFSSVAPTDIAPHYAYRVSNNGGGKWYNICAEWHRLRYSTEISNYYGFHVENTNQPLSLYGLNVERVRTEPQVLIENSEHVTLFSFKSEAGGSSGAGSTQLPVIPLSITGCDNIDLFGATGKIELEAGEGFIEIENSTNVRMTHVKSLANQADWFTIKTDCSDGSSGHLAGNISLGLYSSCSNKIYVDQNSTGIKNGSSWSNAFSSLQDAFSSNNFCGEPEIWVAKGTYLPSTTGDRFTSFNLPNGYKIYGGFFGNENLISERNFALHESILSGEIGNQNDVIDNSYHVVTSIGVSDSVLLDGFVIEKGYADGPGVENRGAGFFNTQNTGIVTLRNMLFRSNFARLGAGFFNTYRIHMYDSHFENNESGIHGSLFYNFGSDAAIRATNITGMNNNCSSCFSRIMNLNGGHINWMGQNSIQ